jgi:putative ATP-dependent endonuclease of the OLD family
MIRKVAIQNYRLFRNFELNLGSGMNILVGNNNTGKSTLIEAINLALTGRINGRTLSQELAPYLLNQEATREYVDALNAEKTAVPPELVIEVYLEDHETAEILRGTNNLYGEDACGIRIQAKLSPEFEEEYRNFIAQPHNVRLAPTEYYRVEWLGFSGNAVTYRSIPASSSVIDPTTIQLRSGVDYHLQQIIRNHLAPNERAELSRQYRSLRERFTDEESVQSINKRLQGDSRELSDRQLSLSLDISRRFTWESSLIAHLDDIPFPFIGRGEQNTLKTLIAIGRRADDAHVVLIEEPENHLSFSTLRKLVDRIETKCKDKQIIVATHSAYVLNKLGLQNMILIGESPGGIQLTDLSPDTVEYFKKLAGFDTLRLVLSDGVILVEGPSDELIAQRAYLDTRGKLPIEEGIDVISVGTAHKRFLELAERLERRAWAVVDNDGKSVADIEARFSDYKSVDCVSIHTGSDPNAPSLEEQIIAANDLDLLMKILGGQGDDEASLLKSMQVDKTGAALKIFESEYTIRMPKYIQDVVDR